MRKLMWFAIGFTAAAALCAYALLGIAAIYIALISALLCIGLFHSEKNISAVAAVVLLGFAAGMVYYWGYDSTVLSSARACDGKSEWIKLEAADYSFETGYGTAVDGKARLDGKQYRIRLYMDGQQTVRPGDILTGRVTLRYTAQGGLETATYHRGEGIFLLAFSEATMKLQEAPQLPGKYFAAWLRKSIADRLDAIFPGDTASFTKALLLGDDSGISFADDIAFQKSGIRHVIAVSGLHVSILFSLIYFVTGRRRLFTLLAGLPVLAVFAAVAGFTPSVTRACIMQGLIVLSVAVDREYDPATALSFAVVTMLAVNPLTITSASFQLSVGCMIGIFAFSSKIRDYLYHDKRFGTPKGKSLKARLTRWLVGSVSVSLSAMAVTVPLCAVYFGMVSVISVLTNLLILWIISFIFCGVIAVCVISMFWAPGASILALVLSLPIRFVLFVSGLLADTPFSVAYTQSPYTALWIIFAYCLLILFFLCKKKSPLLLTGCIAALYFLSLGLSWAEPYTDNFRLTMIDVGQGQCILLQSKEKAYMIDCGGKDPERAADAALLAMGANGLNHLDGLILTHYDSDHANGAVYLLQTVKVETLYLPDTEPANGIRRQLTRQDTPIQWITSDRSLSCGTGRLTLYPAENETDGNQSSMCILFQGNKCDILITGDRNWDGEHQLLQQGSIPDVEILIAGHHGAGASTGLELLNAVKPETVLISVGTGNIHGHPHQSTLTRLARAGCTVRRTDLEGTVIIRG